MSKLFTKEEIINFNKSMLFSSKGYNKADYGACTTYLNGLSDAQLADLTQRLVKYSNTQLNINRDDMAMTADYYNELANRKERSKGVSLDITESGTIISFRYNEKFIKAIKAQPIRRYNKEKQNWTIPNDNAISTLIALEKVGADVKNAIEYIKNKGMAKHDEKSVGL